MASDLCSLLFSGIQYICIEQKKRQVYQNFDIEDSKAISTDFQEIFTNYFDTSQMRAILIGSNLNVLSQNQQNVKQI